MSFAMIGSLLLPEPIIAWEKDYTLPPVRPLLNPSFELATVNGESDGRSSEACT